MCGFCGVLCAASFGGSAAELYAVAEKMSVTLDHRGPDDSGVWADPDSGVALGHRRLSIIDLSPLGRQPMQSESGRFVISFNGEIYNYRDIRRELEAKGRRFRGASDTEVLLASVEEWGVACALRR